MKEKEVKTYSGRIIYEALQKTTFDIETLAEKLGLSSVAIYHWFNSKRIISFKNVQSVCEILNINESDLIKAINKDKMIDAKPKPQAHHLSATINIETEMTAKLTMLIHVPILGSVPAGPLQEVLPKMRSEAEEWEYLDEDKATNPELVFGLHVVGESMIGRDINDGDVIIVDPCLQPENGDVVVAMVDNEATVKTFYKQGNILTLQSANQRIEPIILTESDYDHIKIVGVVIKKVTKMRK
jgi:repressor LexA